MIKKYFIKPSVILCLFILLFQYATGQDIKFIAGNWNEVLAKAKEENKLVFVDIYAVWCGPCKAMAKNVFTQSKVANQFNTQFINYKLDAEKGEGSQLAEKYQVTSFPSYLFIDGAGILIHKMEGTMPADQFISESNNALRKSGKNK